MDCPSWTSTMVMFVQTAVRRSTPKSKTCRRSFGARPPTFTPLTFTPRSKRRPCSPVLYSTVSTIKRCCIASTGFIRRRRWPSPIPAGHRPGPLSASIRDYSNDPIRSRKTCTTGRRRRRRVELFRSRASLAFRACLPAQARGLHLTKISRTVASTSDASIHVQPAENPRLGRATRSQWRKIAQHFPSHARFMRNRGQAATLSFSLISGRTLVGMVTCAHGTPRRLPYPLRQPSRSSRDRLRPCSIR